MKLSDAREQMELRKEMKKIAAEESAEIAAHPIGDAGMVAATQPIGDAGTVIDHTLPASFNYHYFCSHKASFNFTQRALTKLRSETA